MTGAQNKIVGTPRRNGQKISAEKFTVENSRLKAKGFGESPPVAANAKPDGADDPDGRQKNRCVEVVIENAKTPAAK